MNDIAYLQVVIVWLLVLDEQRGLHIDVVVEIVVSEV